MGVVIEPYKPDPSYLGAWMRWSKSTLAVVRLRRALPGFSVLDFKKEAASLFDRVGDALARADERALARLTTPSCHKPMAASLRARPRGEEHSWAVSGITASIKQARVGHNATNKDIHYAQLTCAIDAQVIWEIRRKGERVGGVGSAEQPHALCDYWVMERCLSDDPQVAASSAWKLKMRLGDVAAADKGVWWRQQAQKGGGV